MKFFSLFLLITSLLTSFTISAGDITAGDAGTEKLKQALAESMPKVKVTKISATAIDGLYEVIVGSQVVYMSADARYMIEGDLYDLKTKQNISENAKSVIRLAAIEKLGADNVGGICHTGVLSDSKRAAAISRVLSNRFGVGNAMFRIGIEKPTVLKEPEQGRGAPVVGGDAMFRGRAVEKLIEGLPRRPWQELTECPYEDLGDPGRVHLDCYGNVHLCQGISMGNMWEVPLSELVQNYTAGKHPICGPLVEGGPARLAEVYDVNHQDSYVDACHFCYDLRLSLLDRFPQYLAPKQVYGLGSE